MKRVVCIAAAVALSITAAFAQDLFPRQNDKGKWGFADADGNFVIKPSYDWADDFSENGLCKVNMGGKVDEKGGVKGGSYGFIDRNGVWVVKPKLEYVGSFNSFGLALVCDGCKISDDGVPEGGKFGYINTSGEIVVPVEFDFIGEFDKDGRCWVNKGGKLYKGDKTVDAQIEALRQREKNPKKIFAERERLEESVTGGKRDPFGRKATGGLYGMYCADGNLAINVAYDRITTFKEGLCRVQTKKGYGYVNEKAQETIPCQYVDAAREFSEGRAWVKTQVKKEQFCGYIDEKGNVVIDCIYRSATPFKDGYAIVSTPGTVDKKGFVVSQVKFGIIDRSGARLTPLKYDMVSSRGAGLLYCKSSGKYCFVAPSGKEITPAVIIDAKPFKEGYFRVRVSAADAAVSTKGGPLTASGSTAKDKGAWLLINADGIVASDSYQKISDTGCSRTAVQKDGKWGYIDTLGNEITGIQYDEAGTFNGGYAAVKNSEAKWGFINTSGEQVIPFVYNDASADLAQGLGIVKDGETWGGISMDGTRMIPFLLTDKKDAIKVANTIFVEFGRTPLSIRSVDIFNARKKGYASRFGITDVITDEYWDF